MKLNMNFSEAVSVSDQEHKWVPSPLPGVSRVMLERDGEEKTLRATSIVEYAKDSKFDAHVHPNGEEFIVLSGTFSDDAGNYPAGTYARNPPKSRHSPYSKEGCKIFVKLEQLSPQDDVLLRVNTHTMPWLETENPGIMEKPLFESEHETVKLLNIQKGHTLNSKAFSGGCEILVLEGHLSEQDRQFAQHSWIRCPANQAVSFQALSATQIYIKYGHFQ